MKLLTFKEAEQNETTARLNTETANIALKNSKIANRVAVIGLGLSLLGIGYSIYKDNFVECSQDKFLKQLVENTKPINDSTILKLSKKSDTINKIQLKH
jgi:hypothetical protein